MNSIKIFLILMFCICPVQGQNIFVGTHSKDVEKGLYKHKVSVGGEVHEKEKLSAQFGTTVLVQKQDSSIVYTCGIGDKKQEGLIHCFDTKTAALIDSMSAGDLRPCYLALSKQEGFLFVSNIKDGSVCSIGLNRDGSFKALISKVKIEANGKRFAPHACVVSPEGQYLFVPDIAGNRVCRLKINPQSGELKYLDSIYSENFTGPRHMTFDKEGKRAYLVNQMGEAVTVFNYAKGLLEEVSNVQSLPTDKLDINNHIAEITIHPSGRFVYASNRGHNSLALFNRDLKTGMLSFARCFSSQGEMPWSFAICAKGDYLYCSNNKSHNLVVFTIDQKNGHLRYTGKELSVPNPASVIVTK